MITRVKSVLVGNEFKATATSADDLSIGDIIMVDQDSNIIDGEKKAAEASSIQIGVVTGKTKVADTAGALQDMNTLVWSNRIDKSGHPSAVIGSYEAPVAEKIEFDFTNATITAGHRYVLRIVYKDITEAPGQFTHTYEVVSGDDESENLVTALANKVNKHKNRRVEAKAETKKLILTALEKDDNEGVDSINEYSVVTMDATIYETVPGALLSNQPKAVESLTKTKTTGKPGKGYWKQVRDAERRNMGYKGHVFSGAYPAVEQDLLVDPSAEYDYIVIENDNLYLSNDNQYIKSTPLTTELYIKKGQKTELEKCVKAFVTGQAPASEAV